MSKCMKIITWLEQIEYPFTSGKAAKEQLSILAYFFALLMELTSSSVWPRSSDRASAASVVY